MTKNNSSRTLVNLIGAPSLLAIIYLGDDFLKFPLFSFFVIIILILAALEISSLTKSINGQPLISLLILFLILLQISRISSFPFFISIENLLIGIIFIAMVLEIFRNKEAPLINISILVFSFIWIGLMLGSLSELRNHPVPNIGFKLTLFLFLSVWICDTSAFLFGKNFGKKKILPKVSPNKTWVGTISGFISAEIFLLTVYFLGYFPTVFVVLDIMILGVISGLFGQFGDWAESLFKRQAGIKDSSNVLAGHGGILDRFDSLTFAAPLTLIYCTYFV